LAKKKKPKADSTALIKNPRLMAFIPYSFSLKGRTASVPIIEVMTPIPLTNSGKTTPGKPRML